VSPDAPPASVDHLRGYGDALNVVGG
jgi:hypothetical protein